MGESSCCTADELVLVPPRRHRLKLASPGRYSLCRSTRPGCEQLSPPAGSMGEFSCCTADELVLVPPGSALARVGLARVRYTPGATSSPRAAIGLDELTSPLASQSCRSTRPGCEQLSPSGGSMGVFSCCTAEELVLVSPGGALARVGLGRVRYSPGGASSPRAAIGLEELTSPLASQPCGSPRPGCEQLSPPAGSMG